MTNCSKFMLDFIGIERKNEFMLREILDELNIFTNIIYQNKNYLDLRCEADNEDKLTFALHLYLERLEKVFKLNSLLL